jgi:ribosome-interacting GTPase 1
LGASLNNENAEALNTPRRGRNEESHVLLVYYSHQYVGGADVTSVQVLKYSYNTQDNGGIGYQEIVKQTKGMNSEVARLVCREYKISCAEIILREDVTVDQFIDVIEDNRAYIPVLYVFNKIDSLTIEELDILDQMPNYVPISSQHSWNLEELMEEIWE